MFHIELTCMNMLSCHMQDNPDRANGHIFNVGNPDNEVSVKQLAELMIKVASKLVFRYRLLPLFFKRNKQLWLILFFHQGICKGGWCT